MRFRQGFGVVPVEEVELADVVEGCLTRFAVGIDLAEQLTGFGVVLPGVGDICFVETGCIAVGLGVGKLIEESEGIVVLAEHHVGVGEAVAQILGAVESQSVGIDGEVGVDGIAVVATGEIIVADGGCHLLCARRFGEAHQERVHQVECLVVATVEGSHGYIIQRVLLLGRIRVEMAQLEHLVEASVVVLVGIHSHTPFEV